jgi:hypothetical protein
LHSGPVAVSAGGGGGGGEEEEEEEAEAHHCSFQTEVLFCAIIHFNNYDYIHKYCIIV